MAKLKAEEIANAILSEGVASRHEPLRLLTYCILLIGAITWIAMITDAEITISDISQIGISIIIFIFGFFFCLKLAWKFATFSRILEACENIKTENWNLAKINLIDRQAEVSYPILKIPTVAYLIGYTLYKLKNPIGSDLLQYAKQRDEELKQLSDENDQALVIGIELKRKLLIESSLFKLIARINSKNLS